MKAVLFDMDGVLVDVSLSYRLTIKKVVERLGSYEISFSQIQEYKNKGGFNNDWDLTRAILWDRGKRVSREEVVEIFQEIYLGKNFDGLIRNEKWLLDSKYLEKLKRKYPLGMVTGRPQREVSYVLKRFDKQNYFSAVVTMEDFPPHKSKPHPWGIRKALEILDSESCWYLGDTRDDMEAAWRAGVVPIGVVSCGPESEELEGVLRRYGAARILKNINNIEEVLE